MAESDNMRVHMADPLTFKVVVAVQDLTQFQYKFAELLLIYSLNFFLLLEVEIQNFLFKIHPRGHRHGPIKRGFII